VSAGSSPPEKGSPARESGAKGLANLPNSYQQRPGEQLVFLRTAIVFVSNRARSPAKAFTTGFRMLRESWLWRASIQARLKTGSGPT
jgi:hypothetical protein